jgi:hypothetical protein
MNVDQGRQRTTNINFWDTEGRRDTEDHRETANTSSKNENEKLPVKP